MAWEDEEGRAVDVLRQPLVAAAVLRLLLLVLAVLAAVYL